MRLFQRVGTRWESGRTWIHAACRRAEMRFSFAVAQRRKVRWLIATVPEDAWTATKDPKAILDADEQHGLCDPEVAEAQYTAFTGKAPHHQATTRPLVRRVKHLNEGTVLRHLPSGKVAANAAWLTPTALAHNLTRALGPLTLAFPPGPAPAPSAANSSIAGRHLPQHWPWRETSADPWTAAGHRLRT